ncbi:hypothetical protein CC1G_09177 [Coprinopsis cinerea okayama7|uniref:Uncharacterized protein n=1 Tax=Coprinopsis cinerea (strain Okayama-7 / 130 / ATCC MYA-4618 / FGSC 9003) TaxID=240176 RepID=A8P9U6_COPC7|nr:hypothetical protein CC1G_09177 [Coprinopsis cinerea okayama7\|eukprot:XP_001839843.1 hypothetical protein CC1G_09177 [Coprinopsis cinerea okayama7\
MPSVREVVEYAVSPESSPLVRRETPKLNGSASAFIALIIVLILVILICSTTALYILWENSTKADREYRVRRYKATGLEAASEGKWIARLGKFFHFRSATKVSSSQRNSSSKKRSIRGWAQSVDRASSRDILATIEEQPEYQNSNADSKQMVQTTTTTPSTQSPALSTLSVMEVTSQRHIQPLPPSRGRTSSWISDKSMTVSFVSTLPTHPESSSEDEVEPPSSPRAQLSMSSIPEHVTYQPSVNMSSPSLSRPSTLRTLSADQIEQIYPNGQGRPFATQSGTSITLQGGTKFVEEV